MKEEQRYTSFEEFWPYYVREHASKTTRLLHFVGTTGALACLGGALVLGKPRLLALAPLAGYGPAWVGHFFVEKNRPATFKYPLWSLRADIRMYGLMLRGAMDAEVDRVAAGSPAAKPVADPTSVPVEESVRPDPQTLN
jgi:hypothetical protein